MTTGLCFTQDENEDMTVQLAYHLNSGTDRITSLKLPFTANSFVGSSPWQHDLILGQTRFSDEFRLGGNATTRTYGLCTSPLGDVVAVNVSYHPSDSVEYTTNSDELSYLITSQINEDIHSALSGCSSDINSMLSGLLFVRFLVLIS